VGGVRASVGQRVTSQGGSLTFAIAACHAIADVHEALEM